MINQNPTLDKIWQLSDEYEQIKSTHENYSISKFACQGKILIICNGKAIISFKIKQIFKQKPIYFFVLKATDTQEILKRKTTDSLSDGIKNLSFLKTTLKNIENAKKGRKNKGETFKSLITKFKQMKHVLYTNDFINMLQAENLKKGHVLFKNFHKAEFLNRLVLLIETNVDDFLIYNYDLTQKSFHITSIGSFDFGIKNQKVLDCIFLKDNTQLIIAIVVSSSNDEGIWFVEAKFNQDSLLTGFKKILIKSIESSLLRIKHFSKQKILLISDFDFFIFNFSDSKKANLKNCLNLEAEKIQNIGLAQTLVRSGLEFSRPIQVKVQNSLVFILFCQKLGFINSANGTFFEIFSSKTSSLRGFKIRNDRVYIQEALNLHVVDKQGRFLTSYTFKDFVLTTDFQISKNELLVIILGKSKEIFTQKTDLAIYRNCVSIASLAVDCGLYEFLIFASNNFKFVMTKSKNSKVNLEVQLPLPFDSFKNLSERIRKKLKAVFWWFSNNFLNFEKAKSEYLLFESEKSQVLDCLYGDFARLTCSFNQCGEKLSEFSSKYLKVKCEAGHVAYFLPQIGKFVNEFEESIALCTKCEIVHVNSNFCFLCESKLI